MATIDLNNCPPHLAAAIARADAGRATRPAAAKAACLAPAKHPVAGSVALRFLGEPPTVTHQAKVIGRRGNAGRLSLRDSEELTQARRSLMLGIRRNNSRLILAGPVHLIARFCWPGEFGWHEQCPDLDNATKTLLDVLVDLEWIANDRQVSRMSLSKVRGPEPGIQIILRTLQRPPAGIPWGTRRPCGEIGTYETEGDGQ